MAIKSAEDYYNLDPHFDILRDPEGTFTIDDITASNKDLPWQQSTQEVPNFGYTTTTYWIRLPLQGLDAQNQWVIELDYPPLDQITLYYRSADGNWNTKHSGDHLTFAKRDFDFHNPAFLLPGMATGAIYFKVTSTGVVKFPARL